MVENIITLGLLVLLQAVLGFDNLLYISLESKRAPEDRQVWVRKVGIGNAIFLRIALLFVLVNLIDKFQFELFGFTSGLFEGHFNGHSLIVLAGGIFIIYTATKEVWHMMSIEEEENLKEKEPASVNSVLAMIIVMNLVFSFDSILSAIALTDVFWVMALAIVISGLLMIFMADVVSNFLKKNRMYEVLGLFVLFVVGIMLVTEGAHLAHIKLFGEEIVPMSKTTFYFILIIMLVVDIVQGRYQKKIVMEKERVAAKLKELEEAAN